MSQEQAQLPAHGAEESLDESKPMTFWEHLEELRKRLVWSVIAFTVGCTVAWYFHEPMMTMLFKPFALSWAEQHIPGTPSLHYSSPSANFVAFFRLSMIGGAAMAAPFIFYQLWSFVSPGLYAKEKKYIIPFVFFSTLLFLGGGYFGWRVAFPISFNYFLGLGAEMGNTGVAITPTIMMGEYIDFCTQMLLGFGLVFEMPMLLLFLSIAGIVNHLHLIQFGRYFILVAFIVAAIFTPPDVPDQLAMAVPMCLLYAISIGLVYLFGKPPTEAQRQAFRARKKA
jgi:sec-independent protein translocase protein TatC